MHFVTLEAAFSLVHSGSLFHVTVTSKESDHTGRATAHLIPSSIVWSHCFEADNLLPYLRNPCGRPLNTFVFVGTLSSLVTISSCVYQDAGMGASLTQIYEAILHIATLRLSADRSQLFQMSLVVTLLLDRQ
jgi:hypothetical protein